MRTALVTHTYLDDEHHYHRVARWMKYHGALYPGLDVVAVDNGSSPAARESLQDETGLPTHFLLYSNMPRTGLLNYPYTWRMFYDLERLFAHYDRIIYMESDFFICSERMRQWTLDPEVRGLVTVYCPRYRFAESAFFILTKGTQRYEEYIKASPWGSHVGEVIEEVLPWTDIEHGLVGDRYREDPKDPPLPQSCDFVAQMPLADKVPDYAI